MLKEKSLIFLKECIDKVENATDTEIEKYKRAYYDNMECDKYCDSCKWNKTIEQNGLYYHKCKLGLS